MTISETSVGDANRAFDAVWSAELLRNRSRAGGWVANRKVWVRRVVDRRGRETDVVTVPSQEDITIIGNGETAANTLQSMYREALTRLPATSLQDLVLLTRWAQWLGERVYAKFSFHEDNLSWWCDHDHQAIINGHIGSRGVDVGSVFATAIGTSYSEGWHYSSREIRDSVDIFPDFIRSGWAIFNLTKDVRVSVGKFAGLQFVVLATAKWSTEYYGVAPERVAQQVQAHIDSLAVTIPSIRSGQIQPNVARLIVAETLESKTLSKAEKIGIVSSLHASGSIADDDVEAALHRLTD